jgi:hemerythrin-like domain-containing protein
MMLLAPPALYPEEASAREVLPAEDLMREHGVLGRLLGIYVAVANDLRANRSFPAEVLRSSADLIHRFIEDYHEKLEEQYVFPRFDRPGQLKDLVATLRAQHDAGRTVTERISALSSSTTAQDRKKLLYDIEQFLRMYPPHMYREDTVLFPAFHAGLAAQEYRALGDTFEERERKLFGDKGFEKIVGEVEELEKKMGIYELQQFTPGTPE